MRVFPQYQGPMAYWPRVEAMPGVHEALSVLRLHYCLILATNAADSGEALVRVALRRVGLEPYFHAVLTMRELGARKPDAAFFEAVLHRIGCPAQEVAMIGDDYRVDVVGAKRAGLQAIWFNPKALSCPLTSPVHDAEVRAMAELPAAVEELHTVG